MLRSIMIFIVCAIVLSQSIIETVTKNTCISHDSYDAILHPKSAVKMPEAKVRWAIIALARPEGAELQQRNSQLMEKIRKYSHLHNITIVLFSEKKFPSGALERYEENFRDIGAVRLVDTSKNGFNGADRYGYKYMCKFFAIDVYEYLKDDYDYYMRCDTDCYINEMDYDIFQWALDNHVSYGFSMRKIEAHRPTRDTLPTWTEKYMQKCNLQATALMDAPLKTCFNFYNNFHIGNVLFFLRPDVQHFLNAVNTSGHIQSDRWGDSTIQAYAVRLFMNPAEIVQVPNFSYVHGSHNNRVVSTFGDGHLTTVPQRLPNWKYNPPL